MATIGSGHQVVEDNIKGTRLSRLYSLLQEGGLASMKLAPKKDKLDLSFDTAMSLLGI